MVKVFNFVDPSEIIITKINIYCNTSDVSINYLISETPQISADLIIIHTSFLSRIHEFLQFKMIPFIVYGNVNYIDRAFILGASDFIKDPWNFNEIETRSFRFLQKDILECSWGNIIFSNEIIKANNMEIPFSVNEYKILSLLLNNKNKVVSRLNINYRLNIENKDSRVIDVYINSIRSKINSLSENKENGKIIIKTIRGKGYTIN
jgi:response regulator RpfG family c-di-GMP phosphodiesterase